jgi:antitoxin VapB
MGRLGAMGLNIKNERVHALAREAARRLGASQTSVIERALERLLGELDSRPGKDERRAKALGVAMDFESRLTTADRDRMTTDDLYDDRGLPS